VIGGDPGLQRPRHAAAAFGHDAVADQLGHGEAAAGQELQRGDLAGLLAVTVGQVGLEDRLAADGEDLVAVLFLQQPGRGRLTGQMPCRGLDLGGGQPLLPHRSSPPGGMPGHLIVAVLPRRADLGTAPAAGSPSLPAGCGRRAGQPPVKALS
jgi:hypothetical protein